MFSRNIILKRPIKNPFSYPSANRRKICYRYREHFASKHSYFTSILQKFYSVENFYFAEQFELKDFYFYKHFTKVLLCRKLLFRRTFLTKILPVIPRQQNFHFYILLQVFLSIIIYYIFIYIYLLYIIFIIFLFISYFTTSSAPSETFILQNIRSSFSSRWELVMFLEKLPRSACFK